MTDPSAVAGTSEPSAAAGAGETAWHATPVEEALARLDARREGLSRDEAARRLERFGPNRLPEAPRPSVLRRFLLQFRNELIYALIAAGTLAAALGELVDAAVIFAVVVLNAVIGFVQEGRAESALKAIGAMLDPTALVIREGRRAALPVDQVVPGDMVTLEPGERVPADLRLLHARSLRVDEAALTGELVPVDKSASPVAAGAALGDRTSMAYSGTLVAAGQGVGVVAATGSDTELGRIGAMISGVAPLETPLLRQMGRFARTVTTAVLAVSGLVFAYAVFVQGYTLTDAFMSVVALAVAAIPEGLPAVMTITLAVGVQRMATRNAIIRRLPAVETLGSVSVICSDKTGTLTRNEMTVRAVATEAGLVEAEGEGYRPEGALLRDGRPIDPVEDAVLEELALAAALCNDAHLTELDTVWSVVGDPMEGALAAFAAKVGRPTEAVRAGHPRLDVIPFDARHRYMATLNGRKDGAPVVYVKGAPERILAMCRAAAAPEGERPLDGKAWLERMEALAADGQRVIALARREAEPGALTISPESVERGLVLLGLAGLIDPPREDAVAAVAECRAAGIGVKMITGDHAATARAIAARLRLAEDPKAVTGSELDALDDAGFLARARQATVFARTTPEHKLRLVEALQADGSIIAMTGDGVNDAPALKRADIGVAMGRKGTEAAKEASGMVLADDNFASIVAAVREGRTVHDNLTKVIAWTLPTSGGEAFTVVLAILFGLALPVTPVQILWVNMITAVALGLTLAFEPTEPGTMRRPPRPAGETLLSGRLIWQILFVSALMVAGTFGSYAWALAAGEPVEAARTLALNTLVAMEIAYLFSVRYVRGPSLTWQGAMGTPAVLLGVATVVVAQVALTFAPPLQAAFGTRPLGMQHGLAVVAIGAGLLVVVEIEKWLASLLGR